MATLNIDRILNESPKKRLLIGYDKLKENFTEAEAANYLNIYKDQPLSFILENSRMIFSEPYYGRVFYKEVFEHAHEYPYVFQQSDEIGKMHDYLESFSDKMSETQLENYKELMQFMEETMDSVSDLLFIETSGAEVDGERINRLSDALYQGDADTVMKEFAEVESTSTFFAFMPAVYRCTSDASHIMERANDFISTDDMDALAEHNFGKFVESTLVVGKLSANDYFVNNSVSGLPRPLRNIYTGLADENIMEHANELHTVRVSSVPSSSMISPSRMVNDIFNDVMMEFVKEDYQETKERNDALMGILYGKLFEQIYQEYTQADDVSAPIVGYPFFENTSIEDALKYVTEKDNQYNSGKPSKIVAQHSTEMREDDKQSKKDNAPSKVSETESEKDDDSDKKSVTNDTKPVAPEKKDFATRIQNKAMDIEAKQMKKMAAREEKGQKLKGAAKAIINIPSNIVNKFKQTIRDWDTADDDRRKKYIIEPGFRKKIFRNLKLALTYGITAQVNLLMVPAVAIIRHFSKQKDKRIRVELARELDTEIKICDEKIADANANGDQKQKYQLMRIKSQLEAEALRVKINSKYV